jgi:hypothetical protein
MRWMVAVTALSITAAGAGPVQADPVPREIQGAWTPEPTCGKTARRMIFSAAEVSMIQGDGRRKTVLVETTGAAAERLEVRVTKIKSGEADDPAGAHVGDVLVMRLEKGLIHLIGHGENGVMHDARTARRCAAARAEMAT